MNAPQQLELVRGDEREALRAKFAADIARRRAAREARHAQQLIDLRVDTTEAK